jgi:GxxExxY protein
MKTQETAELVFKDEAYAIFGAAIEVHKELGSGFLEAVYQEALEMGLHDRGVPLEAQKPLPIRDKGRLLKKEYIADLICYGKIIVELKSIKELSDKDDAQILNYLKATGLRLGLLINFGSQGIPDRKRLVI